MFKYASYIELHLIILLPMKSYIRNDKNLPNDQPSEYDEEEELEKDRRIKRLTNINKELIETLKQQNEQLTKKIEKQKGKGGRSLSVKSSTKNTKELESIRKELSNAYKQIDMYKDVIQNLKAKEVSLDHVDKIHEMENKVKTEDAIIDNYQKQLKYLVQLREKQEKELQMYESEDIKQNKIAVEKEIAALKDKLKTLKKNATKRAQIQKRQHAYFVQLEKAVRKLNDEYYPGKAEPKKELKEDEWITEMEWATVKSKLTELRRLYQQNNKKLDMINRQKLRELKSYEQNQLKLKEKTRKLNTLKSRIAELTKLTVAKKGQDLPKEPLPKRVIEVKNDKNKVVSTEREVKRWNAPQTFHVEMGKVLPNSVFMSDKNVLDPSHRYKIIEAYVYSNSSGVPCLLNFVYGNQIGERVSGRQMVENIPQNLELKIFQLQHQDFLWKINGTFKQGILSSITFKSKLGKQQTFEDQNFKNSGDPFEFYPKSEQVPSCFYGATLQTSSEEIKICYLGFEFSSD